MCLWPHLTLNTASFNVINQQQVTNTNGRPGSVFQAPPVTGTRQCLCRRAWPLYSSFSTVSRASPPPSPHPQLPGAAWTLPAPGVKCQEPHYPAALPARSVKRDPHPAPLPPTSVQLFSFTSHFPLLLLFFAASPAAPCFLLPLYHTSYSTFALSLLLAVCISSSWLPPLCISARCLLPHLISVFLLLPFLPASDGLDLTSSSSTDSKERNTGTNKLPRQPGASSPPPQGSSLFLKHKHLHVEHPPPLVPPSLI